MAAQEMMYEYAVDMVCEKCAQAVHKALDGQESIRSVTTNVAAQIVVVEGTMEPGGIVAQLEAVGRKVKLIGSGCSTALEKGVFVVPASIGRPGENSAGAHKPSPAQSAHLLLNGLLPVRTAVAEFKGTPSGHGTALGTVRFVGLAAGPDDSADDQGDVVWRDERLVRACSEGPWTHADVTIDGLQPESEYSVELHQYGDLSRGAASTGDLLDFGQIGNAKRRADEAGQLSFATVLCGYHVWECLGRAIVLTGDVIQRVPPSAIADGRAAVAAVVARSAGVGVNHKMLCACDGTVIWEAEALLPGGDGRAKPMVKPSPWVWRGPKTNLQREAPLLGAFSSGICAVAK